MVRQLDHQESGWKDCGGSSQRKGEHWRSGFMPDRRTTDAIFLWDNYKGSTWEKVVLWICLLGVGFWQGMPGDSVVRKHNACKSMQENTLKVDVHQSTWSIVACIRISVYTVIIIPCDLVLIAKSMEDLIGKHVSGVLSPVVVKSGRWKKRTRWMCNVKQV